MMVGAGISVAGGKLKVLGNIILSDVHDNIFVTPATGEYLTNGAFIGVQIDRIGNRNVLPIGKLNERKKPVDSTQQEALLMLKKLKITEDDAKAEQLCTRREYARWFFWANSQLERSRKHQINSSAALSGSTVTAFDDVSVQDPDFESIQSLAEAGIIRSKLSERSTSTSLNDLEGEGFINFCPERFISRQDLISWRAKVEYEVRPGITEEGWN